jgi:CheY-like chemotaxis protein
MARILVIDDDVMLTLLLSEHLSLEGHQVISAHLGEEGVTAALTAPPDLVLLDVALPDATGFQVCGRLRQNPATRAIPIIMMTGTAKHPSQQSIGKKIMGADDYLLKPLDIAQLSKMIQKVLSAAVEAAEVPAHELATPAPQNGGAQTAPQPEGSSPPAAPASPVPVQDGGLHPITTAEDFWTRVTGAQAVTPAAPSSEPASGVPAAPQEKPQEKGETTAPPDLVPLREPPAVEQPINPAVNLPPKFLPDISGSGSWFEVGESPKPTSEAPPNESQHTPVEAAPSGEIPHLEVAEKLWADVKGSSEVPAEAHPVESAAAEPGSFPVEQTPVRLGKAIDFTNEAVQSLLSPKRVVLSKPAPRSSFRWVFAWSMFALHLGLSLVGVGMGLSGARSLAQTASFVAGGWALMLGLFVAAAAALQIHLEARGALEIMGVTSVPIVLRALAGVLATLSPSLSFLDFASDSARLPVPLLWTRPLDLFEIASAVVLGILLRSLPGSSMKKSIFAVFIVCLVWSLTSRGYFRPF